jgi:type II secretory pathway pseudopilin PulG
MGKINKNQQGFSLVEGLLVVIALTLIIGVGFYVVKANKKDDNVTSNKLNSTTSAKEAAPASDKELVSLQNGGKTLVTLQIPKSWQTSVAHQPNDGSQQIPSCSLTSDSTHTALDGGETKYVPDQAKPDKNVAVSFDVVKQEDTKALPQYFQDDIYGGYDAGIHTFDNLNINGNPAVLYNGSGKPDGSDYKQQYYLVSHNGYVACLRWSFQNKSNPPTGSDYDYSQYLPTVESMAKSIKFQD